MVKQRSPSSRSTRSASGPGAGPRLLSGRNPQIAKGDGDTPVQACIAAMPAWQAGVGGRLDALIVRCVIALRVLGDPDACPLDGAAALRAAAWRPWRAYACLYSGVLAPPRRAHAHG